jgi:hypothetical protein
MKGQALTINRFPGIATVMSEISDLTLIQKQRADNKTKRAQLQLKLKDITAEIKAIDDDDEELAVAERVLARIHKIDLPKGQAEQLSQESKGSKTGKPEGIPTITEMAEMVLRDAEQNGEPSLETKEIVARIRKRWWPSAANNDISPTLWRAATKLGTLHKDGTRYSRIKRTTRPLSSQRTHQKVTDEG